MYFDQQTGAWHAVYWAKSYFSACFRVFLSFSVTYRVKRRKSAKNKIKIYLYFALFLPFFTVCDGKRQKNKKMLKETISTGGLAFANKDFG